MVQYHRTHKGNASNKQRIDMNIRMTSKKCEKPVDFPHAPVTTIKFGFYKIYKLSLPKWLYNKVEMQVYTITK